MSYQNDLTQNNTDLQAILAMANALPEAGSGGGGAVETCSIAIINNNNYGDLVKICYTAIINGVITSECVEGSNVTINNVLCGSLLVVDKYTLMMGPGGKTTVTENATLLYSSGVVLVYALPSSNETVTITIT